jgi:hypothetical protein
VEQGEGFGQNEACIVLEIGALVNVESGDELEEQAKKEKGRGEKENK